jgi:hypothetical protein
MKTTSSLLLTTFAGVVMLGAGGCTGSLPSERVSDAAADNQTTVDPFWDAATVLFSWYAFGDGVGPSANPDTTDAANSDCQLRGGFPASACSVINNPIPGQPFAPSATGAMCTGGTAALVLDKDGNPDYFDLWGAGIGTAFSNPEGDAGVKGYKDLSGYAGVSFDFSGDIVPSKSMRVNFPFMGQQYVDDPPYWGGEGNDAMTTSPLTGTTAAPQHAVIHWADIGGPNYLKAETPPVDPKLYQFNPAAVQAIQFRVFTNNKTATPYSFCVSNLTLLGK